MTLSKQPEPSDTIVTDVLSAFGLGRALEVRPLGGTATRKWDVLTDRGRFVIRRRPDEFADPGSTGFDHAVLRRLDAAGFPVPCPVAAPDGRTALVRDDGTYEVLRWIEGEPFPDGDPEAIAEVGAFLARFHQALADDVLAGKVARHSNVEGVTAQRLLDIGTPKALDIGMSSYGPGKEGQLREDHPDRLTPYLVALSLLTTDAGQRRQLQAIEAQLNLVRRELDQRLYPTLPRAVIHGDFHPGNVRFRTACAAGMEQAGGGLSRNADTPVRAVLAQANSADTPVRAVLPQANSADRSVRVTSLRVAALYDFDYLGVQARAHDVSDGLMFFASRRRQVLNPDDIRSLTQSFVPDAERCRTLLAAYQTVSRLTDAEWEALPWLIRSRWLQMRLRGSRKVPAAEKLAFVLDRFFDVINWLDNEGGEFFQSLRRKCA